MEFTSVWDEAGRSAEAEVAERALANARVASAGVWSFLALAQSDQEFEHRLAVADNRIMTVAAETGVTVDALVGQFRSEYRLLTEARQVQSSGLKCGRCKHANAPHEQGAPCACGCNAFTPATRTAQRVAVVKEGGQFFVVNEETGLPLGQAYASQADAEEAIAKGSAFVAADETDDDSDSDNDSSKDDGEDGDSDDDSDDDGDDDEDGDQDGGDDDSDDDGDDDGDDDSDPFRKGSHLAMMKQALEEGIDPLTWLEGEAPGVGAPEKPGGHTTSPDYSGSYSEVPPGGQATGSRHPFGGSQREAMSPYQQWYSGHGQGDHPGAYHEFAQKAQALGHTVYESDSGVRCINKECGANGVDEMATKPCNTPGEVHPDYQRAVASRRPFDRAGSTGHRTAGGKRFYAEHPSGYRAEWRGGPRVHIYEGDTPVDSPALSGYSDAMSSSEVEEWAKGITQRHVKRKLDSWVRQNGAGYSRFNHPDAPEMSYADRQRFKELDAYGSKKTADWAYHRLVPGERIVHTPGRRPPRPLDVGDQLLSEDGQVHNILATSPGLLRLDTRSTPMHRGPIEGDHSKSIWDSSVTEDAGQDVPSMSDEQSEFLKGNPTGPSKYSTLGMPEGGTVSDTNVPQQPSGQFGGMQLDQGPGSQQTTKPRQMPGGAPANPTFDPKANGGDVQAGADKPVDGAPDPKTAALPMTDPDAAMDRARGQGHQMGPWEPQEPPSHFRTVEVARCQGCYAHLTKHTSAPLSKGEDTVTEIRGNAHTQLCNKTGSAKARAAKLLSIMDSIQADNPKVGRKDAYLLARKVIASYPVTADWDAINFGNRGRVPDAQWPRLNRDDDTSGKTAPNPTPRGPLAQPGTGIVPGESPLEGDVLPKPGGLPGAPKALMGPKVIPGELAEEVGEKALVRALPLLV